MPAPRRDEASTDALSATLDARPVSHAEEVFSRRSGPGTVVSQAPKAGDRASRKGSTVTLSVASATTSTTSTAATTTTATTTAATTTGDDDRRDHDGYHDRRRGAAAADDRDDAGRHGPERGGRGARA